MLLEVIEFYPLEWKKERDFLTGTLRIKLPDIGIHILGIYVSKRNGSWFFALPSRQSFDHATGKQIRYPVIAFENRDQQKELIEAIREKAPAFIEMRLATVERPLNLAPAPEKQDGQGKGEDVQQNIENGHSMQSVTISENLQPLKSITTKQWIDPPARKDCVRGGLKNKLMRKSS